MTDIEKMLRIAEQDIMQGSGDHETTIGLDAADTLVNTIRQLESELTHLRGDRDRLLEAFRHYHINDPDSNDDICFECGFDLRNPIHRRAEQCNGS